MHNALPSLPAIRAFEAAARLLSFTKAGSELGMTQAAVSYQIKLLEEKLGFPLFHRNARRIELTDKGKQLSLKVIDAFEALREAFYDVRNENDTLLVVSSNTTFALNWLATRLVHFQLANPDIAIRIVPYGPAARPEFLNSDVSISACYAPPKGWCHHRLVDATFTPMLSPELAETIGGVHSAEDILRLPLIDPGDPWWKIWFDKAGIKDVDLSNRPATRMGSQALEANRAIAGQGAGILTPYFCKHALENGLLVQPIDILASIDDEAWYLSYPPANKKSRKVRLFRDWILTELQKDGVLAEQAQKYNA
ncbi:LysR family glycine cleavage system transcriptional activator [Roseibium hamelinense]|uniref:LysR family glycine cleavage system transcriptional activator n=1 Tax=Roseibium hamelinense TaxID=150831 RepID=A0A562SNM2_9HYPH|nr:LysR family transcriptional regulator [Roseibium hamelinense]MTI44279.1 LysR family transcriptional regulator [Roseibium hamelinense]TWI82947.1 LysR family glycine cleavage system transcriptional activator [Roseibium hamelinense]